MDDLTRRRLEHNEELFREVNEHRESVHPAEGDDELTFVCECADRSCTGRIRLGVSEYQRIRESESRFIVLPGHVVGEIEQVVERGAGYDVVEKRAA